jgi:hypothetical protein
VSTLEMCAGLAITLRYAIRRDALRPGVGSFSQPSGAGQRRWEACAHLVDGRAFVEVDDRFGDSTASIHRRLDLNRNLLPGIEVSGVSGSQSRRP